MEGRSRWIVLAEIYLCVVSSSLAFQCIPPAMSLIIEEFHFSHHQAGLLMSLFSLPAVFLSMPVGMFADRVGIKLVALAGLLLTVSGSVLIATGSSFAALAIGRIIAGMGSISMMVVAPQAIAQRFIHREVGIAMGILNTATPAGVIVSLNLLSALAAWWGWRSGVWATIVSSIMALLVVAFFFPAQDRAKDETRGHAAENGGKEEDPLAIWLIALIWSLFTAATISLLSFAPDFMVGRGFDLRMAGLSTSVIMGGSLVLSPIIGYMADRYKHQEVLLIVGGLGMAFLIVLLPGTTSHYIVLMALIGISAALLPAPLFSLAAQVVSRDRLGRAFGALAMLNNFGVFIGPQLVGLSRDITGSYRAGFGLIAILASMAAVMSGILRARRGRRKER